jgi:hypothetical protein
MKKISKSLPGEQSQTDQYYDFQMSEAARSAFKMLDVKDYQHLLCEWHDDFVEVHTESNNEKYVFCQVKGRNKGSSLFSFSYMFGCSFTKNAKKGSKTVTTVNSDGILFKQFQKFLEFKNESKAFKVLTNYEFENRVYDTLRYAIEKNTNASKDIIFNYKKVINSYEKKLGKNNLQNDFDEFLSVVELMPESNVWNDFKPKLCLELNKKLEKINENSYFSSEIERIVDEFLKLIKDKSKKLKNLPSDEAIFLSKKAIVLGDLLEYLGVSKDIYESIRSSEGEKSDELRSASRLQRMFRDENEDFIKKVLDCKYKWEQWIKDNQKNLSIIKQEEYKDIFRSKLDGKIGKVINIKMVLKEVATEFQREGIVFDPNTALNDEIIAGGLISVICEYGADK